VLFPEQIHLCDVTLRDGLQNEPVFVPTDVKLALLNQLLDVGFRTIEVTSFVHPKWIPALQDADELVRHLPFRPDVEYRVLIPNQKGFIRFLASSVQTGIFFLSASTAHNEANVNRTTDESLLEVAELVERTVRAGRKAAGAIATSFVCPYAGEVPYENVERIADRLIEAGVVEVAIADTIGKANPRMIYERTKKLTNRHPGIRWSLHLHDPQGYGFANVLAGIAAGITNFDVAQAGLGGCPYAPGAPGNLHASRISNFLNEQDMITGLELGKLPLLESSFKQALTGGAPHANSIHRG
jgi:hydroxymethylglutaryl-CoA lyase